MQAWQADTHLGVALTAWPHESALQSQLVYPLQRWLTWLVRRRVPRGATVTFVATVIGASLAYGVVKGGHVPVIIAAFDNARDAAANAAGFRIRSVALSGERHVSREEVLATAGVTGTSSLLFLDVDAARERLKTHPWIADATVLKLFPGELQIGIKERAAFALWQKDGRVSVIADDGTVLEPFVNPRLRRLPLVVGAGAEKRAKHFLARLERFPQIGDQVRAVVLIAERRWNLRLRNGLDVKLPEKNVEAALELLMALDRDKKLLSRDIVAVDLRLPDRVVVRLSEGAAAARAEQLKAKTPAKKGGAA